mmetsp:Transcript_16967/g.27461  ORF Transcript_16967/g.27461 Transcript_16967/m.27461 type:complete len:475 (-) Transcript_16967:25-1449(-)
MINFDSTVFEINETMSIIKQHKFKRVGLQLPDEFLHLSWQIVKELQACLQDDAVKVFVLGDTSFGSCCVDEVAAAHNGADFIVHYGKSCMSKTSRLPVQFVFSHLELDVKAACDRLLETLPLDEDAEKCFITVLNDLRYEYAMPTFIDLLKSKLPPNLEVYFPKLESTVYFPSAKLDACPADTVLLGKSITWPHQNTITVFLTPNPQDAAQIALQVSDRSSRVYLIDCKTSPCCTEVGSKTGGLLAKRFFKMQKAKDASIFGLLVGTMGVQGYNTVLRHLRKIITDSGRKSYTFLMGKINPQKLANFPPIDAYVLVACPQNTLIDSKEFFQPVVTPIEVEIALGYREWSTQYSCNFNDLLLNGDHGPLEKDEDDDAPHFSLATGGLVSVNKLTPVQSQAAIEETNSSALTRKTEGHITLRYASPAGDALATQTFRGLEPNKGDKKPTKAVAGQVGIASQLYGLGQNKDNVDNAR